MNQRDQLVENFEDASMALFMADVAEHEGEKFLEENERLKNDADFKVPPELDRRCLRTINKTTRRKRALHTGKKVYRVFSKFSVAAVIALALFTSAYAAFPAVRVSTLNLLIEVSDIATELTFSDADGANNETNSVETPGASVPDGAMTIAGYVLPESITDNYQLVDEGSDQVGTWAILESQNDAHITVEVQHGEGNTVNINTESAINLETINIGEFQSVISQQDNGVIIGGVADSSKVNFILVTFEGLDFESSVTMITDFINENSEGTK